MTTTGVDWGLGCFFSLCLTGEDSNLLTCCRPSSAAICLLECTLTITQRDQQTAAYPNSPICILYRKWSFPLLTVPFNSSGKPFQQHCLVVTKENSASRPRTDQEHVLIATHYRKYYMHSLTLDEPSSVPPISPCSTFHITISLTMENSNCTCS